MAQADYQPFDPAELAALAEMDVQKFATLLWPGSQPVDEEWPTLVPLGATAEYLPRLHADLLPGWAGAYCKALARATETPEELSLGLILAAAATATARRNELEIAPGYREPGNLWVVVALESGNRKSAVQRAVCAPLLEWERIQEGLMQGAISRATSEVKTLLARAASARATAARVTQQFEILAASEEAADLEAQANQMRIPVAPQLWTSDSTPSRLAMLLAEHGERMAIMSAEGGIFDMMAGRYTNGVLDLDTFLSAWSGDSVRVSRVGRPDTHLHRPLLTMGLSPQPDVLRGLAARPEFAGRGLIQRILYLLPPSPLGKRNLDVQRPGGSVDVATYSAYRESLIRMLDWPATTTPDGRDIPYRCHLGRPAYAAWLDFARTLEQRMRPGGSLHGSTAIGSKLQGQVARIALVLHCIAHANGCPQDVPITLDTMEAAIAITRVILAHTLSVFSMMGADTSITAAGAVWAWLEAGRHADIAVRDLYRAMRRKFSRIAMLHDALDALEERGYLRVRTIAPTGKGRPSPRVLVRPELAADWGS